MKDFTDLAYLSGSVVGIFMIYGVPLSEFMIPVTNMSEQVRGMNTHVYMELLV